jgi:predicted HicB family RNase H-like nuclease
MKFEMKTVKKKGIPYNVLYVNGIKNEFSITNHYLLEVCSLAGTREANRVFALFAIENDLVKQVGKLTAKDKKSLEKVIQKAIDDAHENPCKHEIYKGLVVESTFVSINHDIHECSLCGKIVRL